MLLLLLVQTIIHAQLHHRLRHCLCPISDCTNKVLRCEAAAAMRSASPSPSLSICLSLLRCSLIDDNILEFLLVFLRSSLSCRLISHSHSPQKERVQQGVGQGSRDREYAKPLASQGQHSCVLRVGNLLNNETFARYWNRIAVRSCRRTILLANPNPNPDVAVAGATYRTRFPGIENC